MSCIFGNPGMSISSSIIAPDIIRTIGCAANWFFTSTARFSFEAERVTIIPIAVEMRSEGTCEQRPSPTVAILYVVRTSENAIPLYTRPITAPPRRFTTAATIENVASPLMNFEAPSIAPKKSDSRCIFSRRFFASVSFIVPELRSASIAICLPGIASRVNLAVTSATRSAPFVTTSI